MDEKSTPWLTTPRGSAYFFHRSVITADCSQPDKATSEIELKFLSVAACPDRRTFWVSASPHSLNEPSLCTRSSVHLLRLYPNSQLIEILQTDLAVMHTLYQVARTAAGRCDQVRSVALFTEPKRPRSSPKRRTCSGRWQAESFASSKNARSFCRRTSFLFDQFHQNTLSLRRRLSRWCPLAGRLREEASRFDARLFWISVFLPPFHHDTP